MESISRHSINFYEAQWQQHQMELTSSTLYPRSNTISVFSDISSDSSSFSSGSPERFCAGGMIPPLPMKTGHRVRDLFFIFRRSGGGVGEGRDGGGEGRLSGYRKEEGVAFVFFIVRPNACLLK
jgi:hypothetical protein